MTTSSGSWVQWATLNNIDVTVITFIDRNPGKLSPPPPDTQEIIAFPTPRAWAQVSYVLLGEMLDEELESESISGLVGPGAAHEFITFRHNLEILPNPLDVLEGKKKFPDEPSAATASAIAIIQYIINSPDSLSEKYFMRSLEWPAEYVVGLQFPAIQAQTPVWRTKHGFDLADISMRYPRWTQRFMDLIARV